MASSSIGASADVQVQIAAGGGGTRRARSNRTRTALALAAALGVGAGGCTLKPAYTRPELPVADRYPGEDGTNAAASEQAAADMGWRDVFADERLQALVAQAIANNRDLRVAALNVERVQALYRIQRAPLYPSLAASAQATYQQLPADLPSSQFAPTEQYSVSLGVTAWELDLFGRVRSLSEQALHDWFATAEARRGAHLALVAQVATAHYQERALEEQLVLARQTLEAVEQSFAVTRRAAEVGTASELDLRTAESQVQTARVNLATYEQQHAQAVNALTFLVGGALPENLPEAKPLETSVVRTELPAGLPSELLTRRPDILAAEHALQGANASIGAARAAFFPSISLTAAGGVSSTELAGLFGAGALTWSFVPRLNLPIFRGGALRASLDVAEVSKQIEVARYERAIQVAFREVADALVARRAIDSQLESQRARVEAEERRFALAEQRYRAGVDRYVTLLTAQRDLYSAQQQLINAQLARLANVATLYRALGGGWNERTVTGEAEAAAPAPSPNG